MNEKLKPYEGYKETGLPWLLSIPNHWSLTRNKNVMKMKKERVGVNHAQHVLLSLTKQGIIARDMVNLKGKFPKEFDTYQSVRPKDIIFCLFDIDETPRTVGLSSLSGMITGAYTVFEVENINEQYLYYYYLSLDNYKQLKPLYIGLRKTINTDTFLRTKMPYPPEEEQEQIVKYLASNLSKINKLINVKKKQIKLLKEQKQVIINQAVTTGLDPNVKMKPSGIEWIGNIPDGWQVTQIGKVYDIELGKMLQPNKGNVSDTIEKYLCALNVFWDRIDTYNIKEMWFSEKEKEKYKIDKGDLIVIEGGDVGVSCIWNGAVEPCYIQNAVHRVREKGCSKNKFLYYWLKFLKDLGYIDLICNKATFAHFTKDKFTKLFILIPPLSEQKIIIKYIENKARIIDKSIKKIENEIELITEYRTTLISDVVTGKVDVRNIKVEDIVEEVEEEIEDLREENMGEYEIKTGED